MVGATFVPVSFAVLLLLNFALALYLTGLVWVVQLVVYPAFRLVPDVAWAAYHAHHTQRMGWVVAGPMVAELGLAVWLLGAADPRHRVAAGASLALVLLAWGITFWGAVPLHNRSAQGHDPAAIARLVRQNWGRTLAWTARAALLGSWLAG